MTSWAFPTPESRSLTPWAPPEGGESAAGLMGRAGLLPNGAGGGGGGGRRVASGALCGASLPLSGPQGQHHPWGGVHLSTPPSPFRLGPVDVAAPQRRDESVPVWFFPAPPPTQV